MRARSLTRRRELIRLGNVQDVVGSNPQIVSARVLHVLGGVQCDMHMIRSRSSCYAHDPPGESELLHKHR
eukprot:scaffold63969_cov26-Tisochrysis_lutea.AAC.3